MKFPADGAAEKLRRPLSFQICEKFTNPDIDLSQGDPSWQDAGPMGAPLALMPGAGRSELVEAMEGHVLAASVITARYERNENGDDFGEEWDESADID